MFEPLWVFDLIRGVVDAEEQTAESLAGHTCRRFLARADLNRVTEAVPYEVAVPTGLDRLDDLKQIPVEVWLDDEGYIRRVRHTFMASRTTEIATVALDLSDFGIEPSDWSPPSVPADPGADAAGSRRAWGEKALGFGARVIATTRERWRKSRGGRAS